MTDRIERCLMSATKEMVDRALEPYASRTIAIEDVNELVAHFESSLLRSVPPEDVTEPKSFVIDNMGKLHFECTHPAEGKPVCGEPGVFVHVDAAAPEVVFQHKFYRLTYRARCREHIDSTIWTDI